MKVLMSKAKKDIGSLKFKIRDCEKSCAFAISQVLIEIGSKIDSKKLLELDFQKSTDFFREWISSFESHIDLVKEVEELRVKSLSLEDELVVQEALFNSYKLRGRNDENLAKKIKQLKQDVTISLNRLRKGQASLTQYAGLGGIPEIQIKYHQLFYSDLIATTGLVSSKTLKSYDECQMISSQGMKRRVFRATKGNSRFAVKEYVLSSENDRKGFEREVYVLSKIRNQFIIPINCVFYDMDEDRGCVGYAEFPFIEGGTLGQWSNSKKRLEGEIQSIVRMIVQGLSFLHVSGVVHRDLKLSNILIDQNGVPLISEFDLSKDTAFDLTQTINFLPTQDVIPPEIEMGEIPTAASDIFSVGVILFKLLFPNRELGAVFMQNGLNLPSHENQDLIDLLSQCLRSDPKERPNADHILSHPFFTRLLELDEKEGTHLRVSALQEHLRVLRTLQDSPERNVSIQRYLSFDGIKRVLNPLEVLQHLTSSLKDSENLKKKIKITFVGEDGIDAGGLLSSLYFYFFEACFSPESPLMEKRDQETYLPRSHVLGEPPDRSEYLFDLFGAAILKCMFDGRQPLVRFPNFVFRYILDPSIKPSLNDLETFDLETARGLRMMLASEGVDSWMLNFEGLKPVGEAIDVTDDNKMEYVNLRVYDILIESRKDSLSAIRKGFYRLEELSTHLRMFTPYDLKLAIFGEQYLSCDGMIAILEFEGFSPAFEVDFVDVIRELTTEELRLFLHFVTNNVSIPVGGLRNPNVHYSSRKLKIQKVSGRSMPVAHTCFFRMDCPQYENKEMIASALKMALYNHRQTAGSFDIV